MKFNYVILGFLFIMSVTSGDSSDNESSEESCESNEWVLTNTTLEWENETKNITTTEFPPKDMNEEKSYKVHIIISGCKNHTYCTGNPNVFVENVECDKTSSELDSAACEVAKIAADLEKKEEWLTDKLSREELYNNKFCIDPDSSDNSSQDDD